VPASFAHPGDVLLLIDSGAPYDSWKHFGSSEYARVALGSLWGAPYPVDLWADAELHRKLSDLSHGGMIHGAKDISDGGLVIALSEACFGHDTGVDIDFSGYSGFPLVTRLFGEDPSRVIIACSPENVYLIQQLCSSTTPRPGVWQIGRVTDGRFRIRVQEQGNPDGITVIDTEISDLRSAWSNSLQSTLSVDTVTA
jgi:phosphoribosylformylglycinamidine synthase